MSDIDLSKKTSSELESMLEEWDGKIVNAQHANSVVEDRKTELEKEILDLKKPTREGKHNESKLNREYNRIKSAAFRAVKEGR